MDVKEAYEILLGKLEHLASVEKNERHEMAFLALGFLAGTIVRLEQENKFLRDKDDGRG